MQADNQRLVYEAESIQRRAPDVYETACHLLNGANHGNADCIAAILTTPPEVYPNGLRDVAAAVHALDAAKTPIGVSSLHYALTEAGVEHPGTLLSELGSHISCAPDLDAHALMRVYTLKDAVNKIGLIHEIAAKGDLEAARHAFADLAPFEYAPTRQEALPLADIENAGPIPDPLFEGGLYPSCLNLCIGESNAGKSMLALTAALSLAANRQLIKPFKPISGGRVLYLSGEDDARVLKQRVADIGKAHNVKTNGIDFVDHVTPLIEFDAAGLAHTTPAWRELSRKACGYELVVIDPLVAWFTLASENDAAAMAALCEHVKRLASDSKAAVLVTHHANKSGAFVLEQAAARGSSALTAAARFVANLARPSANDLERMGLEPQDGARFVRYAVTKNSYGPTTGAAAILERGQGGALSDADPMAARRGDIAETLAHVLVETGAHLTRRELVQGRGELAADVRKRLSDAEGAVNRHLLEQVICHGLNLGLLREEKSEALGRSRVEVLANE